MEIKKINLLMAFVACLTACSENETVNESLLPDDGETTTVKFEMNANTGNYASPLSRSVNLPAITKDNFRIMAFKKSPANEKYLYAQDVSTTTMNYEDGLLSGTVRLPIGEYKFISTYGLAKNGGFALPTLTPVTTELTNDLSITHTTVDGSSVIFLQQESFEKLPSYTLGINPDDNDPVSTSLNRAVARVDILFIQAKKTGGTYTEVSDSADVLGAAKLRSIEMQFTNLNKNINLVGNRITTGEGSLFDNNFQISELDKTITRGTSNEDTKVGTNGFLTYDNITDADIKKGSAHVHGAYVFPYNEGETSTTALTLKLTNIAGETRTITIPDNLPLERNKVTLVKVYVLSGTVFHTDVDFNVSINTAWLGTNSVNGEVD